MSIKYLKYSLIIFFMMFILYDVENNIHSIIKEDIISLLFLLLLIYYYYKQYKYKFNSNFIKNYNDNSKIEYKIILSKFNKTKVKKIYGRMRGDVMWTELDYPLLITTNKLKIAKLFTEKINTAYLLRFKTEQRKEKIKYQIVEEKQNDLFRFNLYFALFGVIILMTIIIYFQTLC